MSRNSIFFKINLLFIVALVATITMFGFIFKMEMQKNRVQNIIKSRVILREIVQNKELSSETLKLFDAQEIKGDKKRIILKRGTRILLPRFRKKRVKIVIIRYKHHQYFFLRARGKRYLIEFQNNSYPIVTITVFTAIILFLITIYWLILKSLKPLKSLERDILSYSNGENLEPKYIDASDEIANINNRFYDYASRATTLANSRKLLIRNIFHELNTPITKGKILAEIVQDAKTKEMLESIFNRLDTLVKELHRVEEISSKSYKLNIKPIPIIELIDSAKELLYIDNIEHNIDKQKLDCDFKSMLMVFKNLIDNGTKYGSDFKIEYSSGKICFLSRGDKLKHPLNYYTQAFVSENRSLGLGLYIVKEILNMHNMELEYSYIEGINRFCIVVDGGRVPPIRY